MHLALSTRARDFHPLDCVHARRTKLNVVQQKDKRCTTNNTTKKNKKLSVEILNEKQRLFCNYFIKYRNKLKAYQKAYQCSYDNAQAHSYELWKNVGIRNEIDKQLKELRDNVSLDTQDIIQKFMDIAFADITDYIEFGQEEVSMGTNKHGKDIKMKFNVVKLNESISVDGTLVSEVKQGKDSTSIKLHDKIKALEWLGDHIGLLTTANKIKFDLEKQKLDFEKSKVTGDIEKSNETIVTLANLINNPVKDRNVQDSEEDEQNNKV